MPRVGEMIYQKLLCNSQQQSFVLRERLVNKLRESAGGVHAQRFAFFGFCRVYQLESLRVKDFQQVHG